MHIRWWSKIRQTFPLHKFEIIFLGFWYLVMIIIWRRMFVFDGESYWAGWGYLWADWSAHITYIQNMAYRNLFLSSHPLYDGIPFRYHFTADLISAVLIKLGIPLVQSLVIPSIVLSVLLVSAVYIFFRKIYKSMYSAMISTTLFLCNGGLGFM